MSTNASSYQICQQEDKMFTPEEIDLCRQIAVKYRKEIKYGGWYFADNESHLYDSHFKEKFLTPNTEIIPLWTISDCLEFLRRKYKSILIQYIWEGWSVTVSTEPSYHIVSFKYDGETPLEALLCAVLAVPSGKKE